MVVGETHHFRKPLHLYNKLTKTGGSNLGPLPKKPIESGFSASVHDAPKSPRHAAAVIPCSSSAWQKKRRFFFIAENLEKWIHFQPYT